MSITEGKDKYKSKIEERNRRSKRIWLVSTTEIPTKPMNTLNIRKVESKAFIQSTAQFAALAPAIACHVRIRMDIERRNTHIT